MKENPGERIPKLLASGFLYGAILGKPEPEEEHGTLVYHSFWRHIVDKRYLLRTRKRLKKTNVVFEWCYYPRIWAILQFGGVVYNVNQD